MADEIDWELTTWEGNRRLQRQRFRTLSLYEKFMIIEQMNEVADFFAERRRTRLDLARQPAEPNASPPPHETRS